ncbi:MAG: sigma-70 family RNA polymerase sigma factor [Candidatus Melainabacteria bacterium]|nr:MAG: sigma-70 family RNA polymerase sigma factor [Candidatus Melainabacteria bacterium]
MQFDSKNYIDIVEKVARVEYRRIPNHMVDCEELMSIGIIALQTLFKDKTEEQMEKYNNAYIATAVRWAIRNELRNRYKWYSLKHTKKDGDIDSSDEDVSDNNNDNLNSDGINVSPGKVREAVYETILSIDSIAAASSDNDSPFDFVKDKGAMPDELAELSELSRLIREAISILPQKERTVVEYRFYRSMQVKEIAKSMGLSSSRITRIVQFSLNHIREYLQRRDLTEY